MSAESSQTTDPPDTTIPKRHPYNAGYADRCAGKDEAANPYRHGSWERNAWHHGWEKCEADIERDEQEGRIFPEAESDA